MAVDDEVAVDAALVVSGACFVDRRSDHEQSVVKGQRGTETGDAPVWQGATREHTGSL
jgi:hypothetical protein